MLRFIAILIFINIGFSEVEFDPLTGELIQLDSLSIDTSQSIYDPQTGLKNNNTSLYDFKFDPESIDVYQHDYFNYNKGSIHTLFFIYPVWSKPIIDNKKIKGTRGLSPLMLGIYNKNYFSYLEPNKWNPFWHWGTLYFIVPYIGLGTEYITKNGNFLGLSTFYIYPTITIGKYY